MNTPRLRLIAASHEQRRHRAQTEANTNVRTCCCAIWWPMMQGATPSYLLEIELQGPFQAVISAKDIHGGVEVRRSRPAYARLLWHSLLMIVDR